MKALARMLRWASESINAPLKWRLAAAARDGYRLVAVRRRRVSLCVLALTATALAAWILSGSGCFSSAGPSSRRPLAPPAAPEPLMRIRLARESERIMLAINGPWQLYGDGGQLLADSPASLPPTELESSPNYAWRLGGGYYSGRRLEFCPRHAGALWVNGKRYDGFLRAVGAGDGRMRPINVVGMEDYVAGVVTAEMPANYGFEALKAQAIAARTYALWESGRRAGEEYFLSNGPEAQCYNGLEAAEAGNGIGRRAARATAGALLTYARGGAEQVLPAFYHSTCGGSTVSVRYFKPKVEPIPPLEGGIRCDWCVSSRYRNWPTVRLAKERFWPGLTAAYPAIGSLAKTPDGVQISELETSNGRIVRVLFRGPSRSVQMLGDEFRLRVGPEAMRSTLCRVKDLGGQIELSDGHGWGHGVGMCQVGANGLARAGHPADRILTYYYPGATIRKAY